jgi:hypothetical protein
MKENDVGGTCGTHVRWEKRVQGFGGRARGKKPLERPRRRWENGIKNGPEGYWLGGLWSGFPWLRIGVVRGLL